jgi:glycosyltransferase involved in cell wall biosynthesis
LNLLYLSRGYTTHDRRFLQAFVDYGHRVSYLRLLGKRLDDRALPEGVNPINWMGDARPLATPLDYFKHYTMLRRILSEIRPEVVLAGPVQTSAFLVALAGYRPLIAMSWGSDLLVDADRSVLMREVTRYTLRHSAGVLGDCQAVREKIQGFGPRPENQIVTFPWGIDLERFSPRASALSLRQELGWTEKPVLISTRTWEPLYAIDLLVKAFAMVRHRHPEARLILLGDGSLDKAIRGLIAQLDLTDYIHAPGRVSYELLPEYFCLADLYVSSALSDGTSISLLEAMACGLPVVVTNSFGNMEWVNPGQNGWLVSPGDPGALTAAFDEALTSPSLLASMAKANVAVARARADWNKNVPELLQLFQRLARPASILQNQAAAGPMKSKTL